MPRLQSGAADPWWRDPGRLAEVNDWRQLIEKNANGTWPVSSLGPPPGCAECVVPQEIVQELRLGELYTASGVRRNPDVAAVRAHAR